jgi:beta-lactamase regulating signal transducer with metallopeptidase domain
MMAIVDSATRFAIAMLLASLWQAPLFALAAWLVLRVQPTANATTRHSVLAAALFASLLLPVATATLATQHRATSMVETGDLGIPRSAVSYRPAKTSPSIPTTMRIPWNDAGSKLVAPTIERANLSIPRWIALAFVAAWLAGAAFASARLIVSLLHLERLKRDALPLSIEYREGLTRWTAAAKGTRNVRLCTSEEIDIPVAVGLFDAMILVPKQLLEQLEPAEIDAIVLHELAHLRRSDDWFNATERFAHVLLFFNPAILWLAGQLDLEREVACDDWVLQQNDALPYATCLAKVAETAIWPHRPMTAPGAFVTRRGMSIRIERLLAKHRDVRIRTSFGPAGSTVAVLAALGIVAALVSPSIAYSVTAARPTPASVLGARHATALVSATNLHVRPFVAMRHIAVAPRALALAHPAAHAHLVAHSAPSVGVPTALLADAAASAGERAGSAASVPAVPRKPDVAELVRKTTRATANAELSESRSQIVAEANAPDYADELASVGYTHLTVDQLVSLKSVGVDADFIREVQRDGLGHPSVDELIRIRAVGVDPKYIATMRARYGESLDVGQIAGMRSAGITPDYAASLTGAGLHNLTADRVLELRMLGVTPDYVRGLVRAGFPDLTIDQVQQLRAVNIDGAFVERAKGHGFNNLSVDQLIRLKVTGVL